MALTINRGDVLELIEIAATRFTAGNKTEAMALALKTLIKERDRTESLYGAHPNSVRFNTASQGKLDLGRNK